MRVFLFLLLISAAALADDFQKGNQAYAEGKFGDARQAYERVLKTGGNAWFNHGNACYRLNDFGQAALSYERALLAEPTHPEAAANLDILRAKKSSRSPLPSWQEKTWRYLVQPLSLWAALGLSWLGALMLAVALFRPKRSLGTIVFSTILILLGASAACGIQIARDKLQTVAVIVTDLAEARHDPADLSPIAEGLPAGSRVHVISTQGDWTYATLPNGKRGWLRSKALAPVIPLQRAESKDIPPSPREYVSTHCLRRLFCVLDDAGPGRPYAARLAQDA